MKDDLVATLIFVLLANIDLAYRIIGKRDVMGYFITLAATAYPTQDVVHVLFYDLTTTYLALLALPFCIFTIPFVGETLHQMRFTAYDQMGRLRLQMEPR